MLDISLLLVLIILFCSIAYSIKIQDLFNPILLFGVTQCVQFIIYYFIYKNIYFVSFKTISIYFLGIFSFFVGYIGLNIVYLANKNNFEKKIRSSRSTVRTNKIFILLILMIGLITIPLTQNYMSSLSGDVNTFDSVSLNLREAYVDNASAAPFYVTYGKYFLLFSIIVIWFDYLNKNSSIKKGTMIILLTLLIYNSFMSLSRTDLLLAILPIIIVYFESVDLKQNTIVKKSLNVQKRIRGSKKGPIFVVILMALLFLFMSNLRSVNDSHILDPQNEVLQYIGRPLPAFEQWIVNNSGSDKRMLIFQPLEKLLSLLRETSVSYPLLATRGQFNVYSYLRVPYLQLGTIGVFITMMIIGFLTNHFYRKYKTKSKYWVIWYAFWAYSLVIAFFDWQFGITTQVYLIIFLLLTASINTVILRKRNHLLIRLKDDN